jgi:hypothetical protein
MTLPEARRASCNRSQRELGPGWRGHRIHFRDRVQPRGRQAPRPSTCPRTASVRPAGRRVGAVKSGGLTASRSASLGLATEGFIGGDDHEVLGGDERTVGAEVSPQCCAHLLSTPSGLPRRRESPPFTSLTRMSVASPESLRRRWRHSPVSTASSQASTEAHLQGFAGTGFDDDRESPESGVTHSPMSAPSSISFSAEVVDGKLLGGAAAASQ